MKQPLFSLSRSRLQVASRHIRRRSTPTNLIQRTMHNAYAPMKVSLASINNLLLSLLGLLCLSIRSSAASEPPNIIIILADDVGWSDFGYNHHKSPIPTPFIDQLASRGVQLKQYYSYSLCTPARASLMTGRYHVNTGLNYVLSIGTPAGLSPDIPTMPSVFKQHNYATAMAGKWHLGHAQHKMSPVGHGFDTFTGSLMWDLDSYTKQMYEVPWAPLMIDWIHERANGSYRHYAEPRHATEAITVAAQDAMTEHAASTAYRMIRQPLFLYVPYTAAHSPLQPMPGHIEKCAHIAHQWRREFCGMVVGFDEGVRNITSTALAQLGSNTLIVVTSDNGGSPWFGGMNDPLKGSKATPYEGGTRVPGLIVDLSPDQRYLGVPKNSKGKEGSGVRQYYGLMHVSDWLPTLLSFAGVPAEEFPEGLDGLDFSQTLRAVPYAEEVVRCSADTQCTARLEDPTAAAVAVPSYLDRSDPALASPREEALLEMYFTQDFIFGEELQAFRYKDYKYIRGIIRDTNYYWEPEGPYMSLSSPSWLTFALQWVIHAAEAFWGQGPFDSLRITFTHVNLQTVMTSDQKKGIEPTLRLFNIREDPLETRNLAALPEHATLLRTIEDKLLAIKAGRPPQQKVWMQFLLYDVWGKTHVPGDCSMNPLIKKGQCMFTHSWIDDNEDDPFSLPGLISVPEWVAKRTRTIVMRCVAAFAAAGLLIFILFKLTHPVKWHVVMTHTHQD